ncbi:YdcH family protein [Methylosinus sp. KRF6]|uniref:YdcH family protein n=1 Tax=Methylosinus sp. KRF6 TaxID=2846853 RepID=UPI001C0DF788|nr:DUF465 domain-containing protein [Methylosinus sp. KRF6]MBU3889789.1 DUF465 domain-containing protein [Methylosinus sp. KRF6]
MIRIPHELSEEFPTEAQLVEQLTRSDYRFGRLVADYDEVNRNIHLIESEEEPTTDEVLEKLKKRRLKLKDEIGEALEKRDDRS